MENSNIQMKIPNLKTIKETAKLLGLPEYFVRQKVKSGEIVAISAGRKMLVNVDRFIEYLNSATQPPEKNEPTPEKNEFGINLIPRN